MSLVYFSLITLALGSCCCSATANEHVGILDRNLIIGGHEAPRNRYPYFVALNHYGGGALIAPDMVLTAGHCDPGHDSGLRPKVGFYSFYDEASTYERFDLITTRRHPKWRQVEGQDDFIWDFALLQLNGTSSYPVVRVNRDDTIPAPHATVTSMGLGNVQPFRTSKANTLQNVNLTAISQSDCAAHHGRGMTYKHRIKESMLCTFDVGKDACDYDSGSPIVLVDNNNDDDKNDLLVALVSWGVECADPFFPGVHARVSAARDWIDATVCELSVAPPADFHCDDSSNNKPLLSALSNLSNPSSEASLWSTFPLADHRSKLLVGVGLVATVGTTLTVLLVLRRRGGGSNRQHQYEVVV